MSSTNHAELDQAVRLAVRERRFDDALGLLQSAVESDPSRAELYESMGTVCTLAGRDVEAAMHFRRTCEVDPERPSGFVNLGALLNRLGDYEAAVETLLKGVQRDSHSATAFYNLGIAYRRLSKRAMAISAYREAIRLNPKMPEAYQNLGNVYLEGGNTQLAVSHFEKALEIRPDFERARRSLERAREAKRVQADEAFNPFGRLVGPSETQQIKLAELQAGMTAEERQADRDEIRTLMQAIRLTANDIRAHVNGVFLRSIDEVQALVAKGRQQSLEFSRAHDRLMEAKQELAKLRRQLKSRVLKLRAHEELVATGRA